MERAYPLLVIFDMDGVLIDSRDTHFDTLNAALAPHGKDYVISRQEHLSTYDGLPTREKLRRLSQTKNLPLALHERIWKDKQDATIQAFRLLGKDDELISVFQQLRKEGYKIAVASNSIRNTVSLLLARLGLHEFIDYVISAEDVVSDKPHPEMYWRCMMALKTIPDKTIIVEDSPVGLQGGHDSKAHVIHVKNRLDVNKALLEKIRDTFATSHSAPPIPWTDEQMTILIPMAGLGSRFTQAGYTFPKPLIEVSGKPMIQLVVENLNIKGQYVFIVQKEHYERYSLHYLLNLIAPQCSIVQCDGLTEGAACTSLLAEKHIDNGRPLLIANSDQFMEWDTHKCMSRFFAKDIHGGILTFESIHPKWSYAKLGDNGFVSEVAEKKPISHHATTGVYFWKEGRDYVRYAKRMIEKDIRTNNEFYIAPVFNHAIEDGRTIRIQHIKTMWGLGAPEDLTYFLEHYKGPL